MAFKIYSKEEQAYGAFNNGEIIENKPLGFPQDGGELRPYSNLFYWANAIATKDSTIGLHPHQGFEIISFVLNGEIKHYDTQIDKWKTLNTGDVQIIRAGNGIKHAEAMQKESRMFQIWMDPNINKTIHQNASYGDYRSEDFPVEQTETVRIKQLIGKNSPFILQTEGIEVEEIELLNAEYSLETAKNLLSIYILEGEMSLNGKNTDKDDFILTDGNVQINGSGKIFVIKSPKKPSYQTYGERMKVRI